MQMFPSYESQEVNSNATAFHGQHSFALPRSTPIMPNSPYLDQSPFEGAFAYPTPTLSRNPSFDQYASQPHLAHGTPLTAHSPMVGQASSGPPKTKAAPRKSSRSSGKAKEAPVGTAQPQMSSTSGIKKPKAKAKVPDSEEVKNDKRNRNTMAAQRSRQKKRDHVQALEAEIVKLNKEVDLWTSRAYELGYVEEEPSREHQESIQDFEATGDTLQPSPDTGQKNFGVNDISAGQFETLFR